MAAFPRSQVKVKESVPLLVVVSAEQGDCPMEFSLPGAAMSRFIMA